MVRTASSQFHVPQPQNVVDDRDGTQDHCRAGEDGAQRQAEERVQHSRRHWNSHGVVEKGEDQVLSDVPQGGATEVDGFGNAAKVAFDEGDACALHRHVGAGPHGNADFRFAERRCVVDAGGGHRGMFALSHAAS